VSKRNIFLLAFLIPLSIVAQSGGQTAFSFVNIETSSRVEALGGSGIAIFDNDVSLVQTTPSLLNPEMDKSIVFSFGDYFSNINLFSFSFSKNLEKIGVFALSLKAINYGFFDRNDENGYNHSEFSANDQLLTFGFAKQLNDRFTLGLNLNLLNSNYDFYNSFAISSNISSTYYNKKKRFTSTFLVKNMGRQVKSYTSINESLPFEMQFAISKELAHLPFRYHLAYNSINIFDVKSPYKLTSQTNTDTGELEIKQENIAKTALRHIVIGGEFNPFRKSLFIRGGFNFQRRFDLTTTTRPALVGFSWGIGFKVMKYRFDYSRSSYHLAAAPNNFSIATNLSTFGF
jgi:hypothetical protein